MQPVPIRLVFGILDVLMALVVASAPAFGLFEGCGAILGYLMCWAAAAPVALVGLWILVAARTCAWAAIGLGIVAVIVAGGVAVEYGLPPRGGEWLVWFVLLPGIVQLPIGLWLRNAQRRGRLDVDRAAAAS